jgi:HK97 gp10 family phage protein
VIQYRINGGRELAALMQQLPVEVETKILGNGLMAGANVIRDEARSLVRTKSGLTRKAIKTARSITPGGQVVAKVKLSGKHAFVGKFLEYGVAAHQIWVHSDKHSLVINGVAIGKMARHPGFAPKPFMRPALDAKASEAIETVASYLTRYLKWGTITAPIVTVDLEEAA